MALEKKQYIDKIEVVSDEFVQVRQVTKVLEDGKELSSSFHRWTLEPGQDVSDQDQRVQAICNLIWTPQVIEQFQLSKQKEPT
jgi:hypothetical protein